MRAFVRPAAAGIIGILLGGLVANGLALATTTSRVIDNVTTAFGTDDVQTAQMSSNGQVIAFQSTGFVPATRPGSSGGFVYAIDLGTSQVEQINVDSAENGHISNAWPGGISTDGRYVTFTDYDAASPGFGPGAAHLRDRVTGTTEQVSLVDGGGLVNGNTNFGDVDISDDGRYVAFASGASNLLPAGADTNGKVDVFVRDRTLGITTRVSLGLFGAQSDGDSYAVAISADGSTIVFISSATNLLGAGADTNGVSDVYAVDRGTLTVERISVSSSDAEANGSAGGCGIEVTPDGGRVAFSSAGSNLVVGDTNFASDIFVRDRDAGTTFRASVGDGGTQSPTGTHAIDPVISADGSRVVYATQSSFFPADGNPYMDVYLTDLSDNTTELISRTPAGQAGDGASGDCVNGTSIAIDALGERVAFNSYAGNLAPDGDGGHYDLFLSRPIPPDADGDGISNSIDTAPGTASLSFSDGTTSGTIVTKPAGYVVSITDAVLGSQGVHVTVAGTGTNRVKIQICGTTVRLSPGADVILTCASVIVDVAGGSTPVEVEIGDGLAVISVPPGATAEIEELAGGGFTIENVVGGSVTVVVDGETTTVDPGETLSGSAWDFDGFKAPIDTGNVLNSAKAGRVIPVRWRIVDATGAPVMNLATATLSVQSLACPGSPTVDQIEEYAAGSSGLLNQGNGNYQLSWQTPSSYANSCKTLRLDIGDGVLHTALFRFTK